MGWLLIAAALTYSTWMLAELFGTRVTMHGYLSELAALTEPNNWFYRGGDITTGFLTGLAGLVMVGIVLRRFLRYAWFAMLVFGLTTIVDGIFPMSCAPSVAPGCDLEVDRAFAWTDHVHAASSVLAGVAILVAMVLLSLRPKAQLAERILVGLYGVLLIWTAIVGASGHHAPGAGLLGYVQRASILAISLWFIWVGRRMIVAAPPVVTAVVTTTDQET